MQPADGHRWALSRGGTGPEPAASLLMRFYGVLLRTWALAVREHHRGSDLKRGDSRLMVVLDIDILIVARTEQYCTTSSS